jgi:outer membrane immunogenic protein
LLLFGYTFFMANQLVISDDATGGDSVGSMYCSAANFREIGMTRLLIAAALAFAAVGQAIAADLPEAAPPPPRAPAAYMPVVAPVYNWGGIYYGINGGYAFGKTEWTNSLNAAGSTGDFSTSGYAVGPTLGANIQADAFVFGVEADFDAMGIQGTNTSAFCPAGCETKETWLGTVRARAGYAVDRVLFYGTAGGAFGNIETGTNGFFDKSTKGGWTAGAGVEAAFADNWTARVEYLYVDLQNATCSSLGNCGFPAGDTVSFTTSVIRVGLDYKFR